MQSTPPGFFLRHPPVFSYYMQSIFPYITPLVYPVSRNRIRMINDGDGNLYQGRPQKDFNVFFRAALIIYELVEPAWL